MNVAMIYNRKWAEFIPIELFSLFKNNPPPIKVYLISDADGKIDTKSIVDHFGDGYSIEFIDAEPLYKQRISGKYNVTTRFTKYTLYRLLLPELITDDRVLYIDTDALIKEDIKDMYNMDLGINYIAGVSDIHADAYGLRRKLGLNSSDAYINAGVILMDLKKIRENGIDKKWITEVNRKSYAANDQCIINLTCKGKIKLIDNRYNCSISTGLDVPKEEIKIQHYTGEKPWIDGNVPKARFWFDAVRDYKKFERRLEVATRG